ncbi:hypothetical protein [Dactylosporangium darangshiense]
MFRRPGSPGYYVWQPIGNTDAIVARLDPSSGGVELVGRARDFYGSPQCAETDGMLACLAIGTLYVWELP